MSMYKPEIDDTKPWQDTDYTAGDFRELIATGLIPNRFITAFPDGNTEIHGAVPLVMKRYPKKGFVNSGQDPIEGLLNVLYALDAQYTLSQEDVPRNAVGIAPVQGDKEKVELLYYNVEELSAVTGMQTGKIHRLLHWVYSENQGLYPWIIKDPGQGYMVAYAVIRQFLVQDLRFEEFLKDVVGGTIRIVQRDQARTEAPE